MKPLLVLIALVLYIQLHVEARAGDMTAADNAREALFAGLVLIDYRQSIDINNHEGAHELNPLVRHFSGDNPSDGEFAAWCAGTVVVHYLVARWLSAENRKWFQYITLGFEAANVGRNARMGFKVNF